MVVLLPGPQRCLERRQLQIAVVELPELRAVGAVGPFDMAVERGRAGRQHEQGDLPLGTGRLELGYELRAASTWMARTGKGSRASSSARKSRAVPAVAVSRTPVTLQREIRSTALKWRRSTRARGAGASCRVGPDPQAARRDGPGVCGWRRGARAGHAAYARGSGRDQDTRRFSSAGCADIETESLRQSRLRSTAVCLCQRG